MENVSERIFLVAFVMLRFFTISSEGDLGWDVGDGGVLAEDVQWGFEM